MPDNGTCRTCRWWLRSPYNASGENDGECRARAPVALSGRYGGDSPFAAVEGHCWCREHEPKPRTRPKGWTCEESYDA